MILINTASLIFLRRMEARWVLGAWLCNFVFMSVLYELNGYNRLLGLSHVIWWTPLLVYLFRRRARLSPDPPFRLWIQVLFLTNAISLVVDYIDVIRYAFGDRT
jgi:hypothetical protein